MSPPLPIDFGRLRRQGSAASICNLSDILMNGSDGTNTETYNTAGSQSPRTKNIFRQIQFLTLNYAMFLHFQIATHIINIEAYLKMPAYANSDLGINRIRAYLFYLSLFFISKR